MANDYELQRQQQIEKNKQRLAELGLLNTVREINQSMAQSRQVSREQRAAKKAVTAVRTAGRVRRSERVQGKEPTNYNESALARLGLDEEGGDKKPRLIRENTTEEVYTFEQVKLLGSSTRPWELFVDGYDASGERIYDKVNGQTCHQCRQKTLGKRTACSCCNSLRGVFCGDCLYMRYGENVEEVNANPEWVCPVCRDLCNCSFHRIKKGWAPTGTLYRAAMREGYQSVAHYLVLTNLREEDRPLAAHLMPAGAAEAAEPSGAAEDAGAAAGRESKGDAQAQPAAVDEQLLELPAAEEQQQREAAGAATAAAEPASRRSRRSQAAAAPAATAAEEAAAAGGNAAWRAGRRGARQSTLEETAGATKRKAAEPPAKGTTPAAKRQAVAGKGSTPAAVGRGLRSAARFILATFGLV